VNACSAGVAIEHYGKGFWSVNQAQTTWNCGAGAVVPAAPGGQEQQPVTGSRIIVFIIVLVRGSVLKLQNLKLYKAQ